MIEVDEAAKRLAEATGKPVDEGHWRGTIAAMIDPITRLHTAKVLGSDSTLTELKNAVIQFTANVAIDSVPMQIGQVGETEEEPKENENNQKWPDPNSVNSLGRGGPKGGCWNCGGPHYENQCPQKGKGKGKGNGKGKGKGKGDGKNAKGGNQKGKAGYKGGNWGGNQSGWNSWNNPKGKGKAPAVNGVWPDPNQTDWDGTLDAGWNGWGNEVPNLGCLGVVLGKGVQSNPPPRRDGDTVASGEWTKVDPKKAGKPTQREDPEDNIQNGRFSILRTREAEDNDTEEEEDPSKKDQVNLGDFIKKTAAKKKHKAKNKKKKGAPEKEDEKKRTLIEISSKDVSGLPMPPKARLNEEEKKGATIDVSSKDVSGLQMSPRMKLDKEEVEEPPVPQFARP